MAPLPIIHNWGMNEELTNLRGLAQQLRLPVAWLKGEADGGRIPCLRVGRRRLFNVGAVRAELAKRASGTKEGVAS